MVPFPIKSRFGRKSQEILAIAARSQTANVFRLRGEIIAIAERITQRARDAVERRELVDFLAYPGNSGETRTQPFRTGVNYRGLGAAPGAI